MAYLTIDDKMIIIGSKAGADTNPDWVHNLRANPRAHVEVGTTDYDVIARELPPPSGTTSTRRSSRRHRGSATTRRKPAGSSRCSSSRRRDFGVLVTRVVAERNQPRRNRYSRSMIVALAMPPPSHIVCNP